MYVLCVYKRVLDYAWKVFDSIEICGRMSVVIWINAMNFIFFHKLGMSCSCGISSLTIFSFKDRNKCKQTDFDSIYTSFMRQPSSV